MNTEQHSSIAEIERDVEARSAVFKKELRLFDLVLSLTGVGAQEAFQLLDNAGGVFYATNYLVLFAIPLVGMKAFGVQSPWWLKVACASGFIVSVIYICFTIIPIIDVESHVTFASKIIATVVLANAVGLAVYFLGKRKQRV